MAEIKRKLAEVYGNSRGLPLTYQARKAVDERFVNDITREKHVVLHGGSKQGSFSKGGEGGCEKLLGKF